MFKKSVSLKTTPSSFDFLDTQEFAVTLVTLIKSLLTCYLRNEMIKKKYNNNRGNMSMTYGCNIEIFLRVKAEVHTFFSPDI